MNAKVIRLPVASTAADDEALVRGCASGDGDALAQLFRRHQPTIRRFVSRVMGGRQEDVEDVLQSTFLAAWRGAEAFRGHSTVRAWLLGIAANQARRHHRTSTRRERFLETLRTVPVVDGPPDQQEQASQRQLMERLRAALNDIPHDLRVAYVLCELEEVPGTEAAAAVGVPAGTMWRRLHTARRVLRERLVREEEGAI